jgi:hypothetical protein
MRIIALLTLVAILMDLPATPHTNAGALDQASAYDARCGTSHAAPSHRHRRLPARGEGG